MQATILIISMLYTPLPLKKNIFMISFKIIPYTSLNYLNRFMNAMYIAGHELAAAITYLRRVMRHMPMMGGYWVT